MTRDEADLRAAKQGADTFIPTICYSLYVIAGLKSPATPKSLSPLIKSLQGLSCISTASMYSASSTVVCALKYKET